MWQDWHYASCSENDDEDETPSDPPDYNTIQQHKQMNPKITLNVGGQRHEIMWRQLEKKPLTRLGRLARAKTHEVRTRVFNRIFTTRRNGVKWIHPKLHKDKNSHKLQIMLHLIAYACHNQCLMSWHWVWSTRWTMRPTKHMVWLTWLLWQF